MNSLADNTHLENIDVPNEPPVANATKRKSFDETKEFENIDSKESLPKCFCKNQSKKKKITLSKSKWDLLSDKYAEFNDHHAFEKWLHEPNVYGKYYPTCNMFLKFLKKRTLFQQVNILLEKYKQFEYNSHELVLWARKQDNDIIRYIPEFKKKLKEEKLDHLWSEFSDKEQK